MTIPQSSVITSGKSPSNLTRTAWQMETRKVLFFTRKYSFLQFLSGHLLAFHLVANFRKCACWSQHRCIRSRQTPVHRLGTLIRRLLLRMALNPSPTGVPRWTRGRSASMPFASTCRIQQASVLFGPAHLAPGPGLTGFPKLCFAIGTVPSGTIYQRSAGSIVELVPTIT